MEENIKLNKKGLFNPSGDISINAKAIVKEKVKAVCELGIPPLPLKRRAQRHFFAFQDSSPNFINWANIRLINGITTNLKSFIYPPTFLVYLVLLKDASKT